jgi:hypothetical protein
MKGSDVQHGVPTFGKEHVTVIPALLGEILTASLFVVCLFCGVCSKPIMNFDTGQRAQAPHQDPAE